ncbi:MAG: YgaP-like transmembrane domain [Bacillota bacterium]
MGRTDRAIRLAIGIFLLALPFTGVITGWWAAAAVVLALFQFVEAALAY